jgi:hypothetical protein
MPKFWAAAVCDHPFSSTRERMARINAARSLRFSASAASSAMSSQTLILVLAFPVRTASWLPNISECRSLRLFGQSFGTFS